MYNGSYQQYGQGPSPPPPTSNYGPPMYSTGSYTAPPPPPVAAAPYYQQPNPALQIAADPNAFAHMFKSHLASLTFNSKPIITNLTVISHEHVQRMSQVVARCMEEHTLTCPPPYRLPALYTIDSICKNVGQPYTTLWADRILRIFMETYRVVDHGVKVRMEELLATWRNSGINGRPLFGDAAQWSIERALYGNAGPPVPAPALQVLPPPPHQVNYGGNSPLHAGQQQSRIRTIERFDRLLAIGSHDQHHNPHLYDADRMQALARLKILVTETPLSGEEMNQIHVQLDALEAEVEARRQVAPPPPPPPQQQQQQLLLSDVNQGMNSPRPNGGPVSLPASLAGALANLGKLGVGSSTPPIAAATAKGQVPAASAVDLIASLRQAGLLPSQSSTPPPPPPLVVDQQDLEYSNMIMSLNLKLTTADMQRELPLGSLEAINFKEMPLQCRQCANRYPSGVKGQASMDQHLDWHFRQNRRAKDSAVRGQSRSWFSRLEDWIRGGHDDEGPSKRNEATGSNNNGGVGRAAVTMTPAQEAELKAATNAFVIAPSDDPGVATKPCPICKELFKSEWSEEEEEWIWKNAIKVNEVYYHGSCHYSAKTLSSAVKSSITGSREGTPQIDDRSPRPANSRLNQIKEEERGQTPPVAGVKRKAEMTNNEDEGGEESTNKVPKSESSIKEEENQS